MAWTNTTFHPLTTIMPTLLVAIGVANGIHIIHHFMLGTAERPDRPVADTVRETMKQMTPPVVMTSLTTAAGLASLAVSSLQQLQIFGLFSALGVLAGMVFSLTLLPAILCLLPAPLKAARRTARTQIEEGGSPSCAASLSSSGEPRASGASSSIVPCSGTFRKGIRSGWRIGSSRSTSVARCP
jgi:predicted RND superfamily exporter protein